MADDTSATDTTETDDQELGEKGEKALAAFKERARTAERDAKAASARAETLQRELEELRSGQMSDQDKAIEAAKKEAADAARAEVEGKYRSQLDDAAIRAAATKFRNPSTAVRFIDIADLARADDGSLDPKALSAALDKVLEDEPGLAAAGNRGSGDGGPRGGAPAGSAASNLNARIRDQMRH